MYKLRHSYINFPALKYLAIVLEMVSITIIRELLKALDGWKQKLILSGLRICILACNYVSKMIITKITSFGFGWGLPRLGEGIGGVAKEPLCNDDSIAYSITVK